MERKKYVYWQDDMWIGYLEDFPDYMTQGETLDELKENLTDIYQERQTLQSPGRDGRE